MSKIKKFFAKKKEEAAFKLKMGNMGTGRALNSQSDASTSSQNKGKYEAYVPPNRNKISAASKSAAQAALARVEKTDSKEFNTSLAAIKAQVKRELEAEKRDREQAGSEVSIGTESSSTNASSNADNRNLACDGVFFRCPMVSEEVLDKKQWKIKIKEFLYQQLEHDRGLTACLIIHNCNTKEKAEECISTLTKYLQNIINHPEEEKYLKIRMSNRIFEEKVRYIEGALDFLQSAGFQQIQIDNEAFLIWSVDNIEPEHDLHGLLEALKSAEIIPLELDRNIRVLLPSQARRVVLPNDFYRLTPEEIKREQQMRTEAIENSQILRTKAMREREEQRNLRLYRYALVRVKFPNGIYLQGTFFVYEKIKDVYDFVQSCLMDEGIDFDLVATSEGKFTDDDMEKTLYELKLIPNILLLFTIPTVSLSALHETNFLKDELLLLVQNL